MSNIVLLSTAFFPPVSWFAVLCKGAGASIEINETYQKQTYRNRCNIAGPNGFQALIIPVSKPYGNRSKTSEVLLAPENNWKRHFKRSLETAYNSSPFFLYYHQQIEQVLFEPHTHLLSLNHSLLTLILKLIKIKADLKPTTCFDKKPPGVIDLRNAIQPGKPFLNPGSFPVYTQVFNVNYAFIPDLSIIDLLFNEGPASSDYLKKVAQLIDF